MLNMHSIACSGTVCRAKSPQPKCVSSGPPGRIDAPQRAFVFAESDLTKLSWSIHIGRVDFQFWPDTGPIPSTPYENPEQTLQIHAHGGMMMRGMGHDSDMAGRG